MLSNMKQIQKIQDLAIPMEKKIQTELLEKMQVLGLTKTQFYILKILKQYGALSSVKLAKKMYVKPPAITSISNRLIENELVERYHDKNDRRAVVIGLTKKGEATVEAALLARDEHIAQYFSHLELQERENLLCLLEKLETIVCEKSEII